MKKTGIYAALLFLLTFSILPAGTLRAQCTVCRATVENADGEKGELKKGVNNGILYLMGIPYLILAGTVFLAVRYRKAKKEEEKFMRDHSQNNPGL